MITDIVKAIPNSVNEIRSVAGTDRLWNRFIKQLTREHFLYGNNLDEKAKQWLFKKTISMVEFEPHSFCNRVCTFCPNLFLDRRTNQSVLRMDIYKKVLEDLANITYEKCIRFALYSEPLASPITIDYIALARNSLPGAEIDVISNGDYLNRDMLEHLRDAGLDILRISVYPKGYVWDKSEAKIQLAKISKRIGIEPEKTTETVHGLFYKFPFENLKILAGAKDLHSTGFDRGGTLAEMTDSKYQRTSPCSFVFNHFNIYHDGAVTPCHNIRNDHPEHKLYIIDYLDGSNSIFDVYSSERFVQWRKHLATVGEKAAPCNSCKQLACDSLPASWLLSKGITRKLNKL